MTISSAALDLVGQGKVEGYLAGHAVTTIAYLVQREKGLSAVENVLERLLSRMKIAPVMDASVRQALTMARPDFEDGVCAAAAQEAGCSVIVTRNPQHFRKSEPPAMLPETFLASQSETS